MPEQIDIMERLREYLSWEVKQNVEWHDHADIAMFSAHRTPDGSIYLDELKLPPHVLQISDNPLDVLRFFPRALWESREVIPRIIKHGFFAWAMRSEGWSVYTSDSSEFQGGYKFDDIAKNERRVETKQYMCVDTRGVMLLTGLRRDTMEVEGSVMRPGEQYYNQIARGMGVTLLRQASKVTEHILKGR